jgi:hypothetical protein
MATETENVPTMALCEIRQALARGERIRLRCRNGRWTDAPDEFMERVGMYGFQIAARVR